MSLSRQYKLFNKNFISVFLINFALYFMFYLTTISCSDYVLSVLKQGADKAGLVTCVFVIGALLSRIFYGSIVDNINLKKTLLIFLPILALISLAYFFINNIWTLLLIRLSSGIVFGICSCACGAIVSRLIPSNKKGVGIGYYALSVILGSSIGPFIAIKLDASFLFHISFTIALLSIFFAFMMNLILKVRKNKIIKSTNNKSIFNPYNYIEKNCIGIGIVTFLIGCAYGGILAFIGAYSTSLNLNTAGSFFFALYALIALFSRPIGGKIFDKLGADFIIIPSLIFFIASLIILAYAQNSIMLLFAAFLCALGYGNASSAAQSLAIKLAPKEKMGLATSTFFIALDFGVGISPYMLGILESRVGFSKIYEISAFIVFIALILYYFLVMKQQKSYQKEIKEYKNLFFKIKN